jgi:pimeloyl-ACP methyl ester carboxylesterase
VQKLNAGGQGEGQMSITWTRESVETAGINLHLVRGGKGSPIVVLHRDIGTPDELPFYEILAEKFEVVIPHHPGFGRSERPDWVRSVRDVVAVYRSLFGQLGLERAALVGLGFGGWIAAELATFAPHDTRAIALVGPMGLKPPMGEIADQAIISYIDYVRKGFSKPTSFQRIYGDKPSSDQLVEWDICREMSFRVAWRPYMYNDSLPFLLRGVQARTLVILGDKDEIVPPSVGELYAARLPNVRLERVPGGGHLIEMEQSRELADLIISFHQA